MRPDFRIEFSLICVYFEKKNKKTKNHMQCKYDVYNLRLFSDELTSLWPWKRNVTQSSVWKFNYFSLLLMTGKFFFYGDIFACNAWCWSVLTWTGHISLSRTQTLWCFIKRHYHIQKLLDNFCEKYKLRFYYTERKTHEISVFFSLQCG